MLSFSCVYYEVLLISSQYLSYFFSVVYIMRQISVSSSYFYTYCVYSVFHGAPNILYFSACFTSVLYLIRYVLLWYFLYIFCIELNIFLGLFTVLLIFCFSHTFFAILSFSVPALIERANVQPRVLGVAGQSVEFMCEASGSPRPELSWRHDGMKITSDHPRYKVRFGIVILC